MSFFRYLAISLLIGLTTSSVLAQPGYYNSPPPGYMSNPGYMTNPGYVPPPPQYIPPPAFYGNQGYGNRGYGNRNYGNQGFGRSMPFNRFNNGPWNRWSNGNNNNYGPDTQWFTDTPRRWMRQGPKEGAGQVFDDFLDAPSRMGDMPPGWSAPTISVPNPIDVADELERGSQDMFNSND